jgi:hypothetical protein
MEIGQGLQNLDFFLLLGFGCTFHFFTLDSMALALSKTKILDCAVR